MTTRDQLREDMEVIGADGVHLGTIDRIEDDRIKLIRADSGQGSHEGHHHYLPIGLVATVEGDRVRLSANGEVAVLFEEEQRPSEPSGGPGLKQERAVLAGGCFWGMQDLIRKLPGVVSTRVGYTGGDIPNATYRHHGNHAEAIEIVYDPAGISFRKLLEFFFQIHDPTTLDRQGGDRGASYRSAIFYTSEDQKAVAQDTIADVEASGLWPGKVVTEVQPASDFWEAEPEHQDYLERIPNGYTCHFVRPGWVLPSRAHAVT